MKTYFCMLLTIQSNLKYLLLIPCTLSIVFLMYPETQTIGLLLTLFTYLIFSILLFTEKKRQSDILFRVLRVLYKNILVFDEDWNLVFDGQKGNENNNHKNIKEIELSIPNDVLEQVISDLNESKRVYKEYQINKHIYELKLFRIDTGHIILLHKNISRLKKAEKKLSNLNLELEEMLYLKKNELQLKKEKFRTIFDKSSDAYFLLDDQFKISLYNEKVKQLFGNVKAVSFYEWLVSHSPKDQPKGGESETLFQSMKKSCDHQGELRFEWLFYTKNGEEFSTEISLTLLPLTKQTLYFMIIRNMMGQKKVEVELRKNLEREKELNEIRSKFVSMASHEFKTPLATILTNMDILELALKKASLNFEDLKIDKYIHRMRSESKRLNTLMEEVLQLGKIEAGKTPFNPKNISLNQFIDNYLIEYKNRVEPENTIRIHKQIEEDNVWIDINLMAHVLDNLLSNAVKYSSKEVDINIESTAQSLIIEVVDQGIGIPFSDFSHLFESFFRASNTDHIQGTGLGLVIAKEFVEMHKGVIVCESEEGKGSTFRIAIPF